MSVTGPDVDVRTAAPGDAAAVADLWLDLAADQRRHGSHLLTDTNREAVAEALARSAVDGRLHVAVSDGEIVGFARYRVERGPLDTDVSRGVVSDLYVTPDWRREGVGSALLTTVEVALRDQGIEVVALEALARNADARRFYERRGYRPHRIEFERPLDPEVENDKRSRRDR
jgi:ribosomal protein S18 acetylase RimI-like enzyme